MLDSMNHLSTLSFREESLQKGFCPVMSYINWTIGDRKSDG